MDLLRKAFDRSVQLANEDYKSRENLSKLLTDAQLRAFVDTKSETAETLTNVQKYEIQAKIQNLVDSAQNLMNAFNSGNFDINSSRNVVREFNNLALYLNSDIKYYSLSQREQSQIVNEVDVLMPIMEELASVAEVRQQTAIGNAYQSIYDKLKFKDFTPVKLSKEAVEPLKTRQKLFKQLMQWVDEFSSILNTFINMNGAENLQYDVDDDIAFMGQIRGAINEYNILPDADQRQDVLNYLQANEANVKQTLGKLLSAIGNYNLQMIREKKAEAIIDLPKADDIIDDKAQLEVYDRLREETIKAEKQAAETSRLEAQAKLREEEKKTTDKDAEMRVERELQIQKQEFDKITKNYEAKLKTIESMKDKLKDYKAKQIEAEDKRDDTEAKIKAIEAELRKNISDEDRRNFEKRSLSLESDLMKHIDEVDKMKVNIKNQSKAIKSQETMAKKLSKELDDMNKKMVSTVAKSPVPIKSPIVVNKTGKSFLERTKELFKASEPAAAPTKTPAKPAPAAAATPAPTAPTAPRRPKRDIAPTEELTALPVAGVEETKQGEEFTPTFQDRVDEIEFEGEGKTKHKKGKGKASKPKTAWMLLVEKVRKERNLKLKDALSYIKKNNLYKK